MQLKLGQPQSRRPAAWQADNIIYETQFGTKRKYAVSGPPLCVPTLSGIAWKNPLPRFKTKDTPSADELLNPRREI